MRAVAALGLLAWLVVEIAALILIGGRIGVIATLTVVFGTALLGTALVRIQGLGVLSRVAAEIEAGRTPARGLAEGAMVLLAGILLVLPGFIGDAVGLALFLPPVRAALGRLAAGALLRVAPATSGRGPRPAPVVDLDPADYVREPRADSPWRPGPPAAR